jgi:hypothetical protein
MIASTGSDPSSPKYRGATKCHLAHISGFRELFIYLNNNQSSMRLRQMIEDYFDNSPPLRGNLSQSSLVSCDDTNK